jgi:glycosyltransferase involved in cell wall biosynthesis
MVLAINVVVGMPITARGPSYTAVRIAEALADAGLGVRLFGQPNLWPGELRVAVGGRRSFPGARLAARARLQPVRALLRQCTVRDVRRHLDRVGAAGQIVYTWSEVPLRLAEDLHAMGVPVVREKINCAKAAAAAILADAYAGLGEPVPHPIDPGLIAKEARELALADAVFCPSPMVAATLRQLGIGEDRLIATSYGWEPERLSGTDRALEPAAGPTFLFVGLICVRKGAHLLLEAWERAGHPGRLLLAGDIEPLIARRYARVLGHDSVVRLPYTRNIGAVFRSADWFVFPSLEEGGPQVTYEAAGCGVPAIVSPMGAGAFTRDGLDGVVLAEPTVDALAEAMVRHGRDRQARDAYAASAAARALDFTWQKVGARRAAALVQRFGATTSAPAGR